MTEHKFRRAEQKNCPMERQPVIRSSCAYAYLSHKAILLHLIKMRLTLALFICCLGFLTPASAAVLLDDHFDNNDIATGGINGGFSFKENVQSGTGSLSESGTIAKIETNGNDDHASLIAEAEQC